MRIKMLTVFCCIFCLLFLQMDDLFIFRQMGEISRDINRTVMMAAEGSSENLAKKNMGLPQDSDFVLVDPVTQQHELLITEIETAEGHLGTALR